MAALRRGTLYIPPLVQCRHRGKINVAHPKSHPERRVFESITVPVLSTEHPMTPKPCSRTQLKHAEDKDVQVNLFEEFLIRRYKEVFAKYSMIVVMQPMAMSKEQLRVHRNKYINAGLDLIKLRNDIVKRTINGTQFANLEPLLIGHNVMCVGENISLAPMVKLVKKTPFNILGGIVGDRLMSHAEIMKYSQLPGIEHVRGQLVGILSSLAGETHQLLNSHQQTLIYNLSEHSKALNKAT